MRRAGASFVHRFECAFSISSWPFSLRFQVIVCGTPPVVFDALVPDDYVSGDGVCDFMSLFAETVCPSHDTREECVADDTCTYDQDGERLALLLRKLQKRLM